MYNVKNCLVNAVLLQYVLLHKHISNIFLIITESIYDSEFNRPDIFYSFFGFYRLHRATPVAVP